MSAHKQTHTIDPWWKAEERDTGDLVFKTIEHIEAMPQETRRRDDTLFHMALYGDDWARTALTKGTKQSSRGDRLSFNLVQAVIDTAQAEVAQLTPKPTMLTARGSWSTQQRAKAMEMTIEGDYDRCDVHAQGATCFLDAAKAGIGALKVYGEAGEVQIERVPPGEILVDPVEAQHGKPRTAYQHKLMCRDAVLDMTTDKAAEKAVMEAPIEDASRRFPWLPRDTMTHPILVVEAWRLPTYGPDGEVRSKGRHVIAVKGHALLDETWERDRFPFAIYRWATSGVGFFGNGLVRELRSIQRELNYTLMKIQDCIHIGSTMRYLVEGASKVNVEQMTNTPGEILRFWGAIPPQAQVVDAVPTSLLQHAEDLIRRGFEQTGVSLLSAMSRKPAGLNSGEAQRVNQDIESKRFVIKSKAYERWLGVDLAHLVIQERRALHEAGELKKARVEVRRGRRTFIRNVDWKEAAMDAEDFKIRVFPTSSLPTQPAGRVATVEQWYASGLIDRAQMLRLLDFPETEGYLALELAPHELVLEHIDRMIEDGEFVYPEPIQDLELSMALASKAAQRYMYEGVPEDRIELLYRYIDDIQRYQEQAMAAAMPAEMPPEAAADPAMAGGDPMADMMAGPAMGMA